MPRDKSLVSVQILIDPDMHRRLRVKMILEGKTWGNVIMPGLEEYLEEDEAAAEIEN